MNKEPQTICDERTFFKVHESHAASLRNFLFYRFGSLEKARDCAQDAFAKLWDNCKSVSIEKAKSYLFTVANRLFLDDAAHQKVVLKFQVREGGKEAKLETNPEYLYRESEFKESLEQAISSLPDRQREVFLLSRIDKMPNREIAEALGISVKAVEKNITSALKSLRQQLDELQNTRI